MAKLALTEQERNSVLRRAREQIRSMTVRVHYSAKASGSVMREMRVWLDHNGIEPALFATEQAGADRVLFRIRFRHPAHAERLERAFPGEAAQGATPRRKQGSAARVLIVDDEPDVREALAAILIACGHSVSQVGSGLEALKLLDQDGPFDLLLTDVMMPGLDGFSLARIAKIRRPDLKVIYLTGYVEQAVARREAGAKFGRLLLKPIRPDYLRSEVASLVS